MSFGFPTCKMGLQMVLPCGENEMRPGTPSQMWCSVRAQIATRQFSISILNAGLSCVLTQASSMTRSLTDWRTRVFIIKIAQAFLKCGKIRKENLNLSPQRQWLPAFWFVSFQNVFSVYFLYGGIILDALICLQLYSRNVFLER